MLEVKGGLTMKCTTIIDPSREEEVLIVAHQKTALVEDIERLVNTNDRLIGYRDKEATVLDPAAVCCFTASDHKVFAHTASGTFQIKRRLYELEETLPRSFVKLHQSCLANMRQIQKFDASIGGTLCVVFKNGHTDYVSRRQLKIVKERFGLS